MAPNSWYRAINGRESRNRCGLCHRTEVRQAEFEGALRMTEHSLPMDNRSSTLLAMICLSLLMMARNQENWPAYPVEHFGRVTPRTDLLFALPCSTQRLTRLRFGKFHRTGKNSVHFSLVGTGRQRSVAEVGRSTESTTYFKPHEMARTTFGRYEKLPSSTG